MSRHTVVVSIGRNVGLQPMNSLRWVNFTRDTQRVIEEAGGQILSRPVIGSDQIGVWEDKYEQCAVFIAFVPEGLLDALKGELNYVKVVYDQAAIGFISVAGEEHLL
jgi:hypothetical protein